MCLINWTHLGLSPIPTLETDHSLRTLHWIKKRKSFILFIWNWHHWKIGCWQQKPAHQCGTDSELHLEVCICVSVTQRVSSVRAKIMSNCSGWLVKWRRLTFWASGMAAVRALQTPLPSTNAPPAWSLLWFCWNEVQRTLESFCWWLLHPKHTARRSRRVALVRF